MWCGEVGQTAAVNRPVLRPPCAYQYRNQSVCMRQGRNRGVQSSEDSDLTVCLIFYISPHNYMVYLDLKSLLYNNFGFQTFVKAVLRTWY